MTAAWDVYMAFGATMCVCGLALGVVVSLSAVKSTRTLRGAFACVGSAAICMYLSIKFIYAITSGALS